MTLTPGMFLSIASIIGVSWYFYPRWRKRWLLRKPFDSAWLEVVLCKITFYEKLRKDEQRQLKDLIRLFVADKQYFGCAGLEITDEIRITIAAEACLLLLNRYTEIYPGLHYILVYPAAFRNQRDQRNPDGTVSVKEHALLGESWQQGKVILSWDDVEHGVSNFQDGHNVVLHEFSHQLDSESGVSNGAPPLRNSSIKSWATVFSEEFAALNEAAEKHQKSVMDYYGATNPAEFFAVATETFFEKPEQLEKRHPELFAELIQYYKVDPRLWV